MIDDIVQMILKEAKKRDKDDFLEGLYKTWDPIRDKIHLIMVEETRGKYKKKKDMEGGH